MDRTVSPGDGVFDLSIDLDLQGRLGAGLPIRQDLIGDIKTDETKMALVALQGLFHQDLKGGLGPLVLKSHALELLQAPDDLLHGRVLVVDLQAKFLGLIKDIALPRELGDEDALAIAHLFRRNVFIGLRIFSNRADMHPAFMRKGRIPHIGGMGEMKPIDPLVHKAGNLPQACKLRVRDTIHP